MKHFKDHTGETWDVVIDGATIKRALDLLHVDLGKPMEGDPPMLTVFDTNLAFKINILQVVCLDQIEQRQLDAIQFAGRLRGEALRTAGDAFEEELSDFFQSLGQPHVVRAIARQREIVAEGMAVAAKAIDSPEMDAKLNGELETLGKSFASTLQSPASTPGGTRSEN